MEVRPVPYFIWYDEVTRDKLNHYYGNEDWQQRIRNSILRIAIDWRVKERLDDRRYIDINGSVWREGDPRHLEEPALAVPSLRGYQVPTYKESIKTTHPPVNPEAYKSGRALLSFHAAGKLLREVDQRYFSVVDFGHGIFESAWMIRGYSEFFSDLLLEPRFAEELLDLLTEQQLEVIDQLATLPCDSIMIVDDYGDQRGIAIGPDRWRQLIKPRLARLYRRIHTHGKMTCHHSCGNVFDIIPDLIEIGLDVLQSLQPEAIPVYEIKKHYGRDLRLWGGFGTQAMLPFGTPEEIRREVWQMKQVLGRGGGYVFSSSKPILAEVPAENAAAFIEAVLSDRNG
jgi:uroporphyrinogen decarboxylase